MSDVHTPDKIHTDSPQSSSHPTAVHVMLYYDPFPSHPEAYFCPTREKSQQETSRQQKRKHDEYLTSTCLRVCARVCVHVSTHVGTFTCVCVCLCVCVCVHVLIHAYVCVSFALI